MGVWAIAAACSATASGDAGSTADTAECSAVATPLAPLWVTGARATCGSGRWRLSLGTTGDAGGVDVFAIDTASPFPWSEGHALALAARDPCGLGDAWERTLTADADYARDASSRFGCGGASGLTWAMRVVDPDGQRADCVAFGEDPEGLIAGGYAADYIMTPAFDPTRCRPL